MPKRNARFEKIQTILKTAYPIVKTQLDHKSPFELLIATILSAQCTDRQVNSVTPNLFEKLQTPEAFAKARITTIEKLIHSTGFYHNKAKSIKNCAKALLENHNGEVPEAMEELVKLPGVGRKTANVVRGAAFGYPGMVVDTHVGRISRRLGMTKNKDAVKVEFDLMKIIPEDNWNDFGLHLIYFGRAVCNARKPKCVSCPIENLCKSEDKTI
ncbi:MAG: endonuclease III [Desulfobacterales bacterium]|nr:endonuclease III [Desulfobacterales bacterium]